MDRAVTHMGGTGGTGLSFCGGCMGRDGAVTLHRELAVGSDGGHVQLSPRDVQQPGVPPKPGHPTAGVGAAVPLPRRLLVSMLRGSPLGSGGTQSSPWAPREDQAPQ